MLMKSKKTCKPSSICKFLEIEFIFTETKQPISVKISRISLYKKRLIKTSRKRSLNKPEHKTKIRI